MHSTGKQGKHEILKEVIYNISELSFDEWCTILELSQFNLENFPTFVYLPLIQSSITAQNLHFHSCLSDAPITQMRLDSSEGWMPLSKLFSPL